MKIFSIYFFLFWSILFSGIAQQSQDYKSVVVSTNGAKLTETESSDSKVLKTLNRGDELELIEIIFPNGSTRASRVKVKYENIFGYITSYFLHDHVEAVDGRTSLSEMELKVKNKVREEEERIKDSLMVAKRNQLKEASTIQMIDEEAEIRRNDSIADAMLKQLKAENRQRAQEYIDSRRTKYVQKYGKDLGNKIAEQKIWIGMTEQMLLDSWGNPKKINRTVSKNYVRKQFVYSGSYVYVVNGVVDAWQD